MSARALRIAVRDQLIARLDLVLDETCQITIDGKPTPMAGERFVSVHANGWQNTATESLDERVGVSVTITDRICAFPLDRLGAEELDKAQTGLETFAEAVVAVMEGNSYDVINAANELITDNTNNFVEPLRFRDGEDPVIRGGEWFHAESEELAGLSITLRFAEARRVRRYEDLGVEIFDTRNLHYTAMPFGPPPSVYSIDIFDWFDQYETARLANVPIVRATTYFFAQDGDDTTGTGTQENPWRTLVKAQAIITAATSPADIRLRFKRGDTWRETTILNINKDDITIDAWGESTAAPPLFTRFTRQYLGSGWTNASGDRYTRSELGSQGWLRDADDIGNPYWEKNTSLDVKNTPRSFYHEIGLGVLHVNAGVGISPNTKNLEYAPVDNTGWIISSDNVRLQNLRLHGHGMHPYTSAGYGIIVQHSDTVVFQECVMDNVEVFYAGYHAIGQIGFANGQSLTLVNCKAGYCTNRDVGGTPGVTPYVSFATNGGQEFYMRDCEVTSGMLPSFSWGATTSGQRTQYFGIYQHTGGAYYAALSIAIGTRFPDNPWQVFQTGFFSTPPYVSDEATEIRSYIVDERPEADGIMGSILGYGVRDRAFINCAYHWTGDYKPVGTVGELQQLIAGLNDFDGLSINCKLTVDASALVHNYTGSFGFWNGAGYEVNMRLDNCRMEVINFPHALIWAQCIKAQSATLGPRIKWRNCIITWSGTPAAADQGAYLGAWDIFQPPSYVDNMVNPGQNRLISNGYFLCEGASSPHPAGYYDGDTGAVIKTSAIPDVAPIAGDPLFQAGAVNNLEYDFNRQRRSATPSIGPYEV